MCVGTREPRVPTIPFGIGSVLPCEVPPSAVLLFQLVARPSADIGHVSSVVAWGAFPVCDSGLCLLQGRFKTPLLRGQPRPQLDQFRKMEALMCSDLDHWLCNLKSWEASSSTPLELEQQQHHHHHQHSPRGSPLHLSADSACSSSTLPGRSALELWDNKAFVVGLECLKVPVVVAAPRL
ncbi:hypothetical protein NHX12_021011 [Muraenolepis orangiensis]|uniref:Uncharacterized protein n=1 Tax=Muraenolepis orangiensis TaxID=630683 RepID=A0A9Q0EP99_9TELE|nr:hypothetical protein NHX12_021011 [Muraenolepis orangiensis]